MLSKLRNVVAFLKFSNSFKHFQSFLEFSTAMVLTFVVSQCFIVKLLTKPILLRKTMQVKTIFKLMKLISYVSLTFSDWRLTPGNKFSVAPIEEMNKEELNACPKRFYTPARKQDGQFHKSYSLKAIRAAIDRYLRMPPHSRQFSIVADPAFTKANKILDAFVQKKAISKQEVEKLFQSGVLGPAGTNDPAQLQRQHGSTLAYTSEDVVEKISET